MCNAVSVKEWGVWILQDLCSLQFSSTVTSPGSGAFAELSCLYSGSTRYTGTGRIPLLPGWTPGPGVACWRSLSPLLVVGSWKGGN